MFSFGIGLISFAGLIFLPVVYLLGRAARGIGAWMEREDGPKDRVMPKVIIAAVIGFAIGCFVQPKWEQFSECYAYTGNWGKCVIPQPR